MAAGFATKNRIALDIEPPAVGLGLDPLGAIPDSTGAGWSVGVSLTTETVVSRSKRWTTQE